VVILPIISVTFKLILPMPIDLNINVIRSFPISRTKICAILSLSCISDIYVLEKKLYSCGNRNGINFFISILRTITFTTKSEY
jgi:hypothetical protein